MIREINHHILLESTTTKFAMAVLLIDEYSEKAPLGDVKVSIKELEIKPIKNLSGDHVFLKLPDGTFTLKIVSECYYEVERKVKLPLDPKNPVININLKPKPSYPFSREATLIRGVVKDEKGNPVSDAIVRIEKREGENKTSEKGDFVIYFKGLKDDDIERRDGKKFVKIDGRKIRLEIKHPDFRTKTIELEAEEGKITSLVVITL